MHQFKFAPIALALSGMLAMVGCAATGSEIASRPAALPASVAGDLRVMSFNLRCPTILDGPNYWSFRKDLMVQTIRAFQPDMLGTQECVADQADYLRERLSDYDFVGVGRDDGKRDGEMCAVFFRRDRFERLDCGHFWLSLTPDKPGSRSWGTFFNRMVTWVKLRRRDTGQIFCLFNTHFDVFSGKARIESAKLLRDRIASIAVDLPVVVTGDFNDEPGSQTYRAMTASFVDAFRATHPLPGSEEGTMHSFGGGVRGPRIDWIFTNAAIQPIAAGIDHHQLNGRFPSDHFPMEAVVRLMPINHVAIKAGAQQNRS